MDTLLIEKLARLRGVGDAYHDYRGDLRHFSVTSKTAILRAMGCAVDDPVALAAELHELEAARYRRLLPQLVTARGAHASVDLNIAARDFGAAMTWNINQEDGTQHGGTSFSADCPELWRGEIDGTWITRRRFDVPAALEPGYHELQVRLGGGDTHRCPLIVSAAECFEPAAVVAGGRLWGMAVQLYTLRSRDNWGIGDFGDLRRVIEWLAPRGAGFIGLNPLHALAPADPARASPYSASSRHFLNVLYIAVPQVAEFAESAAARRRIAQPEFQQRLADLRAQPLVDYRRVADIKFEILELLFDEFSANHLASETERARRFRDFVADGGALLQSHACFDALDQHFCTERLTASGWLSWPQEYRDVEGAAARQFASVHSRRIEFYLYLQWQAHEQLIAAQALARASGMPIGLYGDYAVGANPSGSETWSDQDGYRMGAEIGAPPDPLALKGQGWGIPPQDPVAMEARQLQGFVRLIRHNMRYYGALRLDHVMSLFRLWWVAAGHLPLEGAYVHYPLDQLLTVLALESTRNACLVVGEDLGVVPDEMRRAMPQYGLYHYKVLLFEKQHGRFRRPQDFVRRALGTVTTHDMPTLRSYWEGLDIDLRRDLDLYPSVEVRHEVERERADDKAAVLAALAEQALLPPAPRTPADPFTPQLAHALHVYLARSPTTLVSLQMEDLLGMVDPVNIPGTDREYPNWQRKMSADLEDLVGRADLDGFFRDICAARASR